jgi:2,3-bisphosphoglycerate-independent phosphoglycerate mutase
VASKKFVLIIPDGAADLDRQGGRSPLTTARMEFTNRITRLGVSGLMQTLYDDLPRGSIVAQLGMLGWDPHRYFPHGRASCELLALDRVTLRPGDLAFRANFVRMEGGRLASYNADYIESAEAAALVAKIQAAAKEGFPGFELYHNSDFRNTLVLRGSRVDPRRFVCPEPHESEGLEFDTAHLIAGRDLRSAALAGRINQYLLLTARVLAGERANLLFPWSASSPLVLPSFAEHTGFTGKSGMVGAMDFLKGIAHAGGIDFAKVGDGSPFTDYEGKGRRLRELLADGYSFLLCHVNGPDEASHMGDFDLKVRCLEQIDEHIVRPVCEYFDQHPDQLGGVIVAPDHYTNHAAEERTAGRSGAHSTQPVPFTLWNGRDIDSVERFGEEEAKRGRYGSRPVNHLELLDVLGVRERGSARLACAEREEVFR